MQLIFIMTILTNKILLTLQIGNAQNDYSVNIGPGNMVEIIVMIIKRVFYDVDIYHDLGNVC